MAAPETRDYPDEYAGFSTCILKPHLQHMASHGSNFIGISEVAQGNHQGLAT
jgi:hypothetical protein